MTAHYSAGEPVFGQCLSPGDGLTSLSSIFGAAEGRRVKFKKSVGKTQFAMKCLVLHTLLSFLPVNFMLFLIVVLYCFCWILRQLPLPISCSPLFFHLLFPYTVTIVPVVFGCCVGNSNVFFFQKLPRLSLKAADKNCL